MCKLLFAQTKKRDNSRSEKIFTGLLVFQSPIRKRRTFVCILLETGKKIQVLNYANLMNKNLAKYFKQKLGNGKVNQCLSLSCSSSSRLVALLRGAYPV